MQYILRILLIVASLSIAQYIYASTGSDLHHQMSEIVTQAYHGQYANADSQLEGLIKTYGIETLTKELSYKDALDFLQGTAYYVSNSERRRQYYAFLDKRKEIFPLQSSRSGFAFFDRGNRFFLECQDNSEDLTDKAFYYYCLFRSSDISLTVKSMAWQDIEKLSKRYRYSRNIVDISNLGNIYQQYLVAFPGKKDKVRPILNRIGKRMIKLDPHWTNAYSILSTSYESGSLDYTNNLRDASENYIGDLGRRDTIMKEIVEQ